MLTPIDQVANQNHLQLMKAVIPYIQPQSQKLFSVMVKMLEMQNILRFYQHNRSCVSACSAPSGQMGILDILTDIRNYCEEDEQNMIDQWIQLASTLELYSVFAQSAEEPS